MSEYRSIELYDDFQKILKAFIEDRGMRVIAMNECGMTVELKDGKLKLVTRSQILMFMGYCSGSLRYFLNWEMEK